MSNFEIHFRSAQNSLPREIQTRIKRNEENDGKFSLFQGNNGYSWAKIQNRVVIWRYDNFSYQKDIKFHEIFIPEAFFTKSILLDVQTSKIYPESICVFMASIYGDICYWSNADAPSRFLETFLSISHRSISSIVSSRHNEFFLVLSDESVVQVLVELEKISSHFVSTQKFIPKVITTMFSSFIRKDISITQKSINGVFFLNGFEDSKNLYFCINTQHDIQINKFAKGFRTILAQEKNIFKIDQLKPFKDSKIGTFDHIISLNAINKNNYIYLIIEAYNIDAQEFKYYLSKIQILPDISIVEESVILLDVSSFEKNSKCFMSYSDGLKTILLSLDEKILIINCLMEISILLNAPTPNSIPLALSNCKNSNEFMLMFDDMKFYYLGQKVENSFNQSFIKNYSVDFDRSSIIKSEISEQTNTVLPESLFEQLDYHFKKYTTFLKNFPSSIPNIKIQNCDLVNEIIPYSDYLITKAVFESDATSISRKLQNLIKNSEYFFKFINETKLNYKSLGHQDNSKEVKKYISHVLKNIERAKLSFLVYEASDQNSHFLRLLHDENSKILDDSQITIFIKNIDKIFSNIISNISNILENMSRKEMQSNYEFTCTTLIKSLDVFSQTISEISNFIPNEHAKEKFEYLDSENFSFLTQKEVQNIYSSFILSSINFENKHNLQLRDDYVFIICQKLFESISWFIKNSDSSVKTISNKTFDEIIKSLECHNYVDRAIELSTYFKYFNHVIRLCVEHKRMDILQSLKYKWRDDNFDSKVTEWLATHKRWNLLSEQVNHGNIEEICQNIPHLSWIYFLKQNDYENVTNSLKEISFQENSLFFQKTYCAILKLYEISNNIPIDQEISYILKKIDFQSQNKPFTFLNNINEIILSLEELLFRRLFGDGIILTTDLILDAFYLILKSNKQNLNKIIAMVWSAVVLFDPYLKYSDTVMKSSCQNSSFSYKIMDLLLEQGYSPDYYNESLCADIFLFINNTFENSPSEVFYHRIKCVFEIFNDN